MHRCSTEKHTTHASTHHTQYIHRKNSHRHNVLQQNTCYVHISHTMWLTHIEHYIYTQTRQAHTICTYILTKTQTLHGICYVTCIHRKPHICFTYCVHTYISFRTHIQIICTCYTHTHLYHTIWTHVMFTKHYMSLHTHNPCPHTSPAHTPCAAPKPYVDLRQKRDP